LNNFCWKNIAISAEPGEKSAILEENIMVSSKLPAVSKDTRKKPIKNEAYIFQL
jgi:hypothetical protein